MEVLKHGNTYKKIECKQCGALFSYCEVDVKMECYSNTYYIKSKQNTYEKYITCPKCGKKIILKKSLSIKEQISRELANR